MYLYNGYDPYIPDIEFNMTYVRVYNMYATLICHVSYMYLYNGYDPYI